MSTNPHTGQKQQTKVPTKEYRDNWDLIFGKKKKDESNTSRPHNKS